MILAVEASGSDATVQVAFITAAVAVLTGLLGVAATLLATLLAQRHQSKLAIDQRREERLRELRQAVSDLVAAGDTWTSSQEIQIPSIFTTPGATEALQFLVEFVETDSGKLAGEAKQTLSRRISDAALIADDERLLDQLSTLRTLVEQYGAEVIGPMLESKKKTGGQGDFALTLSGLRYVRRIKSALSQIEGRAGQVTRDALNR